MIPIRDFSAQLKATNAVGGGGNDLPHCTNEEQAELNGGCVKPRTRMLYAPHFLQPSPGDAAQPVMQHMRSELWRAAVTD